MATVGDLLDDPVFGPRLMAEIEEMEHRYDLREARHCAARGLPMSKALWKRLRRYRTRHKEDGRG